MPENLTTSQPGARPHVIIMGTRGVPAAHGGFETFAERLALYLVEAGWRVTVYCQGSSSHRREVDDWRGVTRIHIPVKRSSAAGTIEFDIKATLDVLSVPGTILTLGYNTGFLCILLAARGRTNLINMDGIEWKRNKYGRGAKAYLWLNERLAAMAGTHLIADHPEIAGHHCRYVSAAKISTIAYGGDSPADPDAALLADYALQPWRFMTVIARPEPENSILEIVQGFCSRSRDIKLVVLGNYQRDHDYQARVLDAAGPGVIFPGAIYDKAVLGALRAYSIAYVHGHQVGGTNPSLVEALAAGNAVIAHDNPFNRWVAGEAGIFFRDRRSVDEAITTLTSNAQRAEAMRAAAQKRFVEAFTWESINGQYEVLLRRFTSDGTALDECRDVL
ncbi:DUF1972 domain-containing protein [Sphingosinithalassobacter portus]|uniref:DUF1972 domain-containing protein n=1 Tax=Stakelama portus TaxID=2676234 RepID=UPI000D6E4A76|nr:DUF1972 domain-containing protein [Sphingosinithalassobacter portus]